MKFLTCENGNWVNAEFVQVINLCRDHCKHPAGSDEDRFRWRVTLVTAKDSYIWRSYDSREEAIEDIGYCFDCLF